MKKILIIIFLLCSYIGFSQTTNLDKDEIDTINLSYRIDTLGASITPTDTGNLSYRIDTTGTQITYIYDSISVHRDSIDNFTVYILDIQDSIAVHRDSINNHAIDIATLQDSNLVHRDSLDNYITYINALNDSIDTHRDSIDNHATDIAALQDTTGILRDSINNHAVDITALQDTNVVFRDSINDHASNIADLQDSTAAQRIDIDSKLTGSIADNQIVFGDGTTGTGNNSFLFDDTDSTVYLDGLYRFNRSTVFVDNSVNDTLRVGTYEISLNEQINSTTRHKYNTQVITINNEYPAPKMLLYGLEQAIVNNNDSITSNISNYVANYRQNTGYTNFTYPIFIASNLFPSGTDTVTANNPNTFNCLMNLRPNDAGSRVVTSFPKAAQYRVLAGDDGTLIGGDMVGIEFNYSDNTRLGANTSYTTFKGEYLDMDFGNAGTSTYPSITGSHVYINDDNSGGSLIITDVKGLHLETDASPSTTNYGFYIDGFDDNYCSGNIGAGEASPSERLSLKSASGQSPLAARDYLNSLLFEVLEDGRIDLRSTTTGSTAIGQDAGSVTMTGVNNTLYGYSAGLSLTSSFSNVAIGYLSGSNLTSGNGKNVYIGFKAGQGSSSSSAESNIGIGEDALVDATTAIGNIAIGSLAGENITDGNYSTIIGFNACRTQVNSVQNCAFGYRSLIGATQSYNSVFGGNSFVNMSTGNYNAAIGYNVGNDVDDGDNNVFIGANSGALVVGGRSGIDKNTFVGAETGRSLGNNSIGNVFIGYRAGSNETGSNYLYIENSNSATPLIYGDFASDYVTINDSLNVKALYSDTVRALSFVGHSPFTVGSSSSGISTATWQNGATVYNDETDTLFLSEVHIKVDGDATVTGDMSVSGQLITTPYHSNSTFSGTQLIAVTAAADTVQVTNGTNTLFTNNELVGFTENGDSLIVPANGDYNIFVNLGGRGKKDVEYDFFIKTANSDGSNETIIAALTHVWTKDNTTESFLIFGYGRDVSTDDRIWLDYVNNDTGDDFTLYNLDLNIQQFHLE